MPPPRSAQKEKTSPDPNNVGGALPDLTSLTFNFWEKWRYWIIGVAALTSLSLLGWKVVELIQERIERSIQASFQEATDEAAKLSFAQRYPKASQTGFIYLQIANERYDAGQYSEAAVYYQKAQKILPSLLKGRALLGEAISLIQSIEESDKAEGENLLKTITEDSALFDTIRAQAAYNRALLYWEISNWGAVKDQVNFIETLEQAGFLWVQKAQALFRKIPQLSDMTEIRPE